MGMDNFRSEPPQDNIPEAAKRLIEAWQETAKHATDMAHARRTIFNAYVAEGFTEAQALELIKTL